jgi:hypothetical protein
VDILAKVEDSGRFGRDSVRMTYGDKVESIKINRKNYQKFIELTHTHSKVSICEAILKSHKANPYKNVDELIGDLQLVLVESWSHFKKLDPNKRAITVEDLIGEV